MSKDNTKLEKGTFKVPHVYVLLFLIMIVAVIATYIVPSGQFGRVIDEATGRTIINPADFKFVENTPVGFFGLFRAIPEGMNKAVDIIFMVVLTLAGMEIINQTNVLKKAISNLIYAVKGKEILLVIIVSIVFTAIGAFVGWAEGVLMFVPIGVSLAVGMGFDAIVGLQMITLTAGVGFAIGPTNIYTVGVAQGLLGLPLFSGIEFRLIMLLILTPITIWYIVRYAKKVKDNPSASVVSDLNLTIDNVDISDPEPLNMRDKLVILTLLTGFFFAVYGCLNWGWFMKEIGACFTLAGIIGGLIGGRKLDQIAEDYALGAKKMIYAGITIGLARAILVIIEDGQIIDTIIYYLANLVGSLPTYLSAVGMYIVQIVINTFIPSGSGQAVVTIPILGPLSEMIGSTQQVAVIAYQLGDGFTNRIIPTLAALMAALGMAGGIPWTRYAKWTAPIMLIWLVLGAIFVAIADFMMIGPF
jgi:uncharacterized ion transporter superfamily protein YfcC